MEIGTAEATNGTEPSGALARLKAAREVHGAAALQEALQCCAEVPGVAMAMGSGDDFHGAWHGK